MRLFLIVPLFLLALLVLPQMGMAQVKQSSSGICHCPGGSYYDRTTSFTDYPSLQACLLDNGREPKRGQGNCNALTSRSPAPSSSPTTNYAAPTQRQSSTYDRNAFGGWQDDDGDCLDTRGEILAQLSTGTTHYTNNGCRVDRGRWNDPYTGHIFTNAGDMDIDHLVPLAWAWDRGAASWSQEKRRAFANDPVNLFAVDAGTNRSKGAKGPLEWLPPNTQFHCQYVLRFERVLRTYDIQPPAQEYAALQNQKNALCR